MEFHGTFFRENQKFHGIPFHGTRKCGKSSVEFIGNLDLDKIPWNSMEPTGVAQMLFKKFHGTLEKVPWNFWIRISFNEH